MSCAHPPSAPELQQMREELAQLRREYELFAGRISRDVHAALLGSEGFATALREHAGAALDARGQHLLQKVLDNSGRGLRVVDSLTRYDRWASAPLRIGPVDMERLVQRARTRAAQAAPDVPVHWHVAGTFPALHADAALLDEALTNVLDNAIRFRDPARPLAVEISGSIGNGAFELRVADNGTGFDPALSYSLFQPFTRLHPEPQAGMGMGLAGTRRIIERLGGSVTAEAPRSGGAVVTLTLPLHRPAAGPADATGAALRVLLIDDDAMVRDAIRTMLERCGHQATVASGGVPGLLAFEHALRNMAFDLVLTDWSMPQGGGERVAEAVKAISPATPVVVVTGIPGAAEEAVRARVDAVLPKPLRLATLRATVAQFANRASRDASEAA